MAFGDANVRHAVAFLDIGQHQLYRMGGRMHGRVSKIIELRKPLALQRDRMAYKAYQDSTASRLSKANPENTPNDPRPTKPR